MKQKSYMTLENYKYHLIVYLPIKEVVEDTFVNRFDIICSEFSNNHDKRAYSVLKEHGDLIQIEIFAKDSTILRAVTSSIERWFVTIDKTIELYKELRSV